MRLPAIALVSAFAAGIAIGFWPALVKAATSSHFLVWSFTVAVLFLAAVGLLVRRRLLAAGPLSSALLLPKLAMLFSMPMGWLTGSLIHSMSWIAHFPRWSCRIPPPPLWLTLVFQKWRQSAKLLPCSIQTGRSRQMIRSTKSSNRNPTAASYS
jgi:hypothetical protein